MSATREQVYAALQKADAAGNTDDARQLARMYASMPPTPSAAPAPQAAPTNFGDFLSRSIQNVPKDAGDMVTGLAGAVAGVPENIAYTLAHPVDAVHNAVNNTGDMVKGAAKAVTDIEEAPAYMLAHPNQAKLNTYKYISDHPVQTAMNVVPMVGEIPGVAGALGDVGELAKAGYHTAASTAADAIANTPAGRAVTPFLNGQRTGDAFGGDMRAATAASLNPTISDTAETAAQSAMQADQINTAAQARAARLAAVKQRAQARRGAYVRQGQAAAAAYPAPQLDVGVPAHLSDIGDTGSTPALANRDQITANMNAADAQYRDAMEKVGAEQAANGVGVSDTNAAKALLAKARAVVDPNPVGRPAVDTLPVTGDGTDLHQRILNALQPQKKDLTDAQAAEAKALGQDVFQYGGGKGGFYTVTKPNLETVDTLRRYLGKVASGQIADYPAVQTLKARGLYNDVSNVMDEYVKGTSAPVQANWAAGKKALEPFETPIGAALTDPSVPSSSIIGKIVAGGRDGVLQAQALAGPEAISAALRSHVQNTLAGKGADEALSLVAPGTELGDAISAHPPLVQDVNDYLHNLTAHEQGAQQAQDLAARAKVMSSVEGRLGQKIDNTLSTANQQVADLHNTAQEATLASRKAQQQLSILQNLPANEVGPVYLKMLSEGHLNGTVSLADFNHGQKLAKMAEQAYANKKTRDAFLKNVGITLGAGTLPVTMGATLPVAAATGALGLGAGILGRNFRVRTIFRGH